MCREFYFLAPLYRLNVLIFQIMSSLRGLCVVTVTIVSCIVPFIALVNFHYQLITSNPCVRLIEALLSCKILFN